ncbi:MAG: 50S ribosomal protein L18e [Candidatus Altiarchaeota archaeon]|nr:50S ribosomal protein L18e [Candidatus Altiarchaeota archaeon]
MGLKKRIKSRNFTDTRIIRLLGSLSKSKTGFWKAVAKKLSAPRENRPCVNVNKLERHASEGFDMVVPGKVLGVGTLSQKLSVSAYAFSQSAVDKIEAAGGKVFTIEETLESNSQAKKLKMVM